MHMFTSAYHSESPRKVFVGVFFFPLKTGLLAILISKVLEYNRSPSIRCVG